MKPFSNNENNYSNYDERNNRIHRNDFENINYKIGVINQKINSNDNKKDQNAVNIEFNNFSKTASEFKNFNKNKIEKPNSDPLANREAFHINQHNLIRNKNSDLQKEYLLEENDFDHNKKHSYNLKNKKFSNTAFNFNSKNNDNQSSTLKFRGIQPLNK